MYKVIYMTGAPAAGKSTTANELRKRHSSLCVFEYGARLTELASSSNAAGLSQNQVREKSAGIITREHVEALDLQLIDFCKNERVRNHVIIDSHPVTKESFGFRVTAFSIDKVKKLAPSEIWVLYTSAEETIRRITSDPAGRPLPTEWEANLHTQTQASVATTYGIAAGAVVYMFDTTANREELYQRRINRLP